MICIIIVTILIICCFALCYTYLIHKNNKTFGLTGGMNSINDTNAEILIDNTGLSSWVFKQGNVIKKKYLSVKSSFPFTEETLLLDKLVTLTHYSEEEIQKMVPNSPKIFSFTSIPYSSLSQKEKSQFNKKDKKEFKYYDDNDLLFNTMVMEKIVGVTLMDALQYDLLTKKPFEQIMLLIYKMIYELITNNKIIPRDLNATNILITYDKGVNNYIVNFIDYSYWLKFSSNDSLSNDDIIKLLLSVNPSDLYNTFNDSFYSLASYKFLLTESFYQNCLIKTGMFSSELISQIIYFGTSYIYYHYDFVNIWLSNEFYSSCGVRNILYLYMHYPKSYEELANSSRKLVNSIKDVSNVNEIFKLGESTKNIYKKEYVVNTILNFNIDYCYEQLFKYYDINYKQYNTGINIYSVMITPSFANLKNSDNIKDVMIVSAIDDMNLVEKLVGNSTLQYIHLNQILVKSEQSKNMEIVILEFSLQNLYAAHVHRPFENKSIYKRYDTNYDIKFKNNYLLWDKCIENISCNEYIIYLNKEYYVENIDTMMIESNKYKLIQIRYK